MVQRYGMLSLAVMYAIRGLRYESIDIPNNRRLMFTQRYGYIYSLDSIHGLVNFELDGDYRGKWINFYV